MTGDREELDNRYLPAPVGGFHHHKVQPHYLGLLTSDDMKDEAHAEEVIMEMAKWRKDFGSSLQPVSSWFFCCLMDVRVLTTAGKMRDGLGASLHHSSNSAVDQGNPDCVVGQIYLRILSSHLPKSI